jgi:hypothetical protein
VGPLLFVRHGEGAAAVKENRVVALRVCLRKMREQVIDIATDAGAAVAFPFSQQMGIDADPLTSRRRAGRDSPFVHRFGL